MASSLDKIESLLNRGVEEIFVKETLRNKLLSGKPLRVKLGIDPTGPNIHIGRASILRKLKNFQDLGHKIVLIVGDFTALIGDPSDKLGKRPMLTKKEIAENLADYKSQLGKILDIKNVEFRNNSEWLGELRLDEVARLAESFSVQQMLARRNFKDRYESGDEISLREFMYPLMQGYDSVQIDSDVEIGGFDQLFNLKAGRIIQKHYDKPEQDIMTCTMLEGTDGRKMSTSWGNVININDEPSDMFGKVMSVKDELILKYFLLATDVSEKQIEEYKKQLDKGENPKNIKIKLAEEIVSLYHGEDDSKKARKDFEETFEKGGVPEDIKEVIYKDGTLLVDILLKEGIVASKSEYRRLEEEGAIKKIDQSTYKIGKRRFLRVVFKKTN